MQRPPTHLNHQRERRQRAAARGSARARTTGMATEGGLRCSARLAAYGIALLIGWTAVLGFLAQPLGVNFSPKLSGLSSELSHSEDGPPAALGQLPGGAGAVASTPSYNPNSVPELQKAASLLLVPEKQRGPLATLVRDMSSALAKQAREEEETQRKIVLLQPAVSNYNPGDAEQLSKAAVDAATPGEVPGALSKLLRDLGKTVADQQAARRGIDVRLSRAEAKAERSSSRLRTLRQDALQGRSGVVRISLLFGQLADEIEQALEEATERAIEQAAAEAGKPRPAGLAPLPPPSERWQATLGELRGAVEAEQRAATETNASAHAELQALRLTSAANATRLAEHAGRLEEELSSLRATHASHSAPPSLAAPPLAAALAGGGLAGGGLAADPAPPSDRLPAPYDGRVTTSQPTAPVGVGGGASPEKDGAYRGMRPPEGSTAVLDYLADATAVGAPAATAQAVPLAAEQAAPRQTAPIAAQQLSGAPPLTTTPTTASGTTSAPGTSAPKSTIAQPSSPDAAAPPQSAAAVTEAVAAPAVTNPCAGKRCPPRYDMVDRGDHCTCRPASAPPDGREV
jgi:hypothetical protein